VVPTSLTQERPSTLAFGARRSVPEQLAGAYTAGWTVLLAVAGTCALVPAARWVAQHELALALHVHIHPAPAPTIAAFAWLLVNNVHATGWPLLPVLLHAQRHRVLRRVVHAAVAVSVSVNLLPVAAAIGVYRAAIVPYLPHLPLELYAITTGPATWALACRRTLTSRQLAAIALSMLLALAGAALLETCSVPHR